MEERKVLKSTLLEFVDVCSKAKGACVRWIQCVGVPRREKKKLKKQANVAREKALLLAAELEWSSGLDYFFFSELAEKATIAQIFDVLNILDVEVTDEVWYVEGVMYYNPDLERYVVFAGKEEIALLYGDKIAVCLDGDWLNTFLDRNKCGKYCLHGCENLKLGGSRVRIFTDGVAE